MNNMFNNATLFNQDLSVWSVSSVTDCEGFSSSSRLMDSNRLSFSNCTPIDYESMDYDFQIFIKYYSLSSEDIKFKTFWNHEIQEFFMFLGSLSFQFNRELKI